MQILYGYVALSLYTAFHNQIHVVIGYAPSSYSCRIINYGVQKQKSNFVLRTIDIIHVWDNE